MCMTSYLQEPHRISGLDADLGIVDGTADSVGRGIRVIVPHDPPMLTPGVARALLAMLRQLGGGRDQSGWSVSIKFA